MTEKQAMDWLTNMQRCLREDPALDSATRSHLNEIHRFLIEFCCPGLVAEAREALRRQLEAERPPSQTPPQ